MDTTKKLADALRAVMEGSEYKSLGGDDPTWHRIAMPTRSSLQAARVALSEYDALLAPATTDADDVRELRKWLNEEPNRPIDRAALARVLSKASAPEPVALTEEVMRLVPDNIPGSEWHLTALMAPFGLTYVVGQDRQHLLSFGRAVWSAALAASQPAPEQSFVPPMMEEGSREAAMVVLERDASGKPTVWCDPEIAPIVGALIKAGIRTSWSCSGHGHRPGVIGLVDGRHLMIFNTDEDHEKAEAVFTTDINGVNDALLESQAVPEDQIEPLLQKLCDAIKGGLDSYRCTYIVDADDGQRGMPLADLLTLPGDKTIKRGEDEIEMIADAMYHVIKPVLLAAAPTPSKGEA